ncbi:hypothetical protein SUBVAR_07186 [Subdoligranulum variabile DSM 15176]|uniref:Uncharacterized protein n=1 Tax=Subdoligranulum variabile DSM 15176 TaxID=411471 RepID=D1PS03_9FIRM|nr:hypothetical protein SUBVAR_07186 [Subdoligranulum variabile DSM 15176]
MEHNLLKTFQYLPYRIIVLALSQSFRKELYGTTLMNEKATSGTEVLCKKNRNIVLFFFDAIWLFQYQLSIVQLGVVVRSENCDRQVNTMIQRRKLCSMHNFRRCLWWL